MRSLQPGILLVFSLSSQFALWSQGSFTFQLKVTLLSTLSWWVPTVLGLPVQNKAFTPYWEILHSFRRAKTCLQESKVQAGTRDGLPNFTLKRSSKKAFIFFPPQCDHTAIVPNCFQLYRTKPSLRAFSSLEFTPTYPVPHWPLAAFATSLIFTDLMRLKNPTLASLHILCFQLWLPLNDFG